MISLYYKVSNSDRVRSECIECYCVFQKEQYQKNRPAKLEYAKEWYTRNPERAKEIKQEFKNRNPNYHKEYNAWYNERKKAIRKKLTERK